MSEHQKSSLIASASAMLCRIIATRTGTTPLREDVAKSVRDLVDTFASGGVDETSWEMKPMPGMYDVYLELREAAGTLTAQDMVRGGLMSTDFSSGAEFVKHNSRIYAHRQNPETEWATKTCSSCGEVKARDQFPKKGGSKCKKCVDANTRDRRNAKEKAK